MQQCLPFTVLKPPNVAITTAVIVTLQQCLPFTVLKPNIKQGSFSEEFQVATVLTVYGIETTVFERCRLFSCILVATVLTVYGIETSDFAYEYLDVLIKLQQCLPFTVLKLFMFFIHITRQCIVATVLTVYGIETFNIFDIIVLIITYVATVLTVYGIETLSKTLFIIIFLCSCNSAYRLRY